MRLAALMFLVGGVLVQQLRSLPPLSVLVFSFACLVLIGIRWRGWAWRGLFWLFVGCGWFSWHAHLALDARLSREMENRAVDVTGTVSSLVSRKGLLRFVLTTDGVGAPQRIRVAWYDADLRPAPGEQWQLRLRLKQPMGFANPGGFDYERWLFRRGIGATGYVLSSGNNRRVAPARSRLVVWRDRIAAHVARLTRTLEHGAIIRALTVGDRSGLETQHWNTLNATGTNHLLAISGLHVGLVGMFGFAIGRRLWAIAPCPGVRREQAGAGMALAWAVAYAWLSGLGIPAQRAVIMVGGALFALIGARTIVPGQFLSAALFLVLLADPLAVLDNGLWLSFLAVASILWSRHHARPGLFRAWNAVQWSVALGLLPALLLFFQRVSLAAPLINLLAIPIVAVLVVPLCLAGVAALALNDGLARGFWLVADRVIGMLWWGLELCAQLPGVLWTTAGPGAAVLLASSAGALALMSPLRRVLWVPAIILLGVGLFGAGDRPRPGAARLTLLDVGQGLSVTIETATHVLVYDTGPRFPSGFDTGSGVVAPWLRSRGWKSVDLLVISHGDMDHRGGVAGLAAALPIAGVLAAEPVPGEGATECARGQAWQWDGVSFQVLHPPRGMFRGNDGSCVLRVVTQSGAVLLSGDIETAAENWLVEHEDGLAAGVLVAPHHGSATSSTPRFVAAVKPDHVLVAAGYGNRFGLPNSDVTARYVAQGAKVSVSGCEGALSVDFGAPVAVQGWRETGARYWTLQPCGRP